MNDSDVEPEPEPSRDLTRVCVLGTDLAQPIAWTLVGGVEDVRSQQRL